MILKLSKIFIPLPGRSIYSAEDLCALKLHPDFIEGVTRQFQLTYIDIKEDESNVCFAENKEVRPEYRTTFNKADILHIIFHQLPGETVNMERDEVVLQEGFFESATNGRKMNTIKEQKKNIRATMLEQRNRMPRHVSNTHSEKIGEQLWEIIRNNNIRTIHSYLTMGSEVNVLPLLQKALDAGLTVVVPKTLKKRRMQNLVLTDLKNMEPGVFGTYHPRNAEEYTGSYDLIIVAGLAFGKEGYRVGYGGGYYDTFLAEHQKAKKIGVCFPFQIIEEVPTEPHDIKLDLVIS